MTTGYIVRNRATGALLGNPAPGRLKSAAYWRTEGIAYKALRSRAASKAIRDIHEWDIIPLMELTQ